MGRASDRRKERVKSLLERTLSEIIRAELNDPRVGLFSITDIRLAADLTFAEVSVAVVGGRAATEQCVAVLEKAAPLIRNRVRDETDLRIIPQLRFKADLTGEYVDEIERLLQTIPRPADEAADAPVAAADEDAKDGKDQGRQ
jgi:ribosome-binding factor A